MKITAYPEINYILEKLLLEIKKILGNRFMGMYLSGSLAYGDFNYRTSDVDFVIVASAIPDNLYPGIKKLTESFLDINSKWRKRFEGLIMTEKQFRRYDPKDSIIPSFNLDSSFTRDSQDTDSVIQRFIIRNNPIILDGPDPRDLIETITEDELKKATLTDLNNWWKPKLETSSYVSDREHQAYAVLTMCRILYTLEKGGIVSKIRAANWAKETLGDPWAALIDRSLNWKNDDRVDDAQKTLDFIKYTLERSSKTK